MINLIQPFLSRCDFFSLLQSRHACPSFTANRTLPEGDTPPRKPPPPAGCPKGDLLLPPPKNLRALILFEAYMTPAAPLNSPPPPPPAAPAPPTEIPSPMPLTPPLATDGLTAKMVCTAPPGPQKKPPSLVALMGVCARVSYLGGSYSIVCVCERACMCVSVSTAALLTPSRSREHHSVDSRDQPTSLPTGHALHFGIADYSLDQHYLYYSRTPWTLVALPGFFAIIPHPNVLLLTSEIRYFALK